MAVFRIEKTQNYTVMSNHHLRNKALTLKAKGLLSQMLSLPENWDYTLKGLSQINRESVEAIRTAVLELETAGYITRRQTRDPKGKMSSTEYTIYELPQDTPPSEQQHDSPSCDFPITDKPFTGNPLSDCPTSGNATQLNKECKAITEKSITDLSSTHSIPFTSPHTREENPERNGKEATGKSAFDIYREIILDNIEYDYLLERYPHDHDRINEIVDLMLETVCTARRTIRIASDDYPAELVKAKFLKLDSSHIEFVLDCLQKNTTEIRNIKKYLLAVLFNALSTIGSYYTSLVAHDMASGKLYGSGV